MATKLSMLSKPRAETTSTMNNSHLPLSDNGGLLLIGLGRTNCIGLGSAGFDCDVRGGCGGSGA